MFLVYGGEEELVVRGYADASFQTDRDDCLSQSGFVYFAISLTSRYQANPGESH